MSMEIYNIKLLSGQELVSEIVYENEKEIILKYPLYIITQVTSDAQPIISLARYCPFSKSKEVFLNKNSVSIKTAVRDSMKSFYYANLEYILKFLEGRLDSKLDTATEEIYKDMQINKDEHEEDIPDILSDMVKPDNSRLN